MPAMKFPIASVKSKVPAFLVARYLRSVDGVSCVVVHGGEGDWGMDVTFCGDRYYLDKQLGEVQAFSPHSDNSLPRQAAFVLIVKSIPQGFASVFRTLFKRRTLWRRGF
jgi:hypothetical protein